MDYYEQRDNLDDTPSLESESEIASFFDGCTVFITGSTGFIGHLVLEKILRCCPGVKKIYLLVRMKKGVSEAQRTKEIIECELFDQVARQDPHFSRKIVMIAGDCGLPNLSMSEADRERILDTNIVLHIAAALSFDDHYRNSFHTNVVATKDLLELARRMSEIKAFTYVSTAYAHVDQRHLKEEFVNSRLTFNEMKMLLDDLTDKEISGLMPVLTKNATTYSIMKSITENVVREYIGELPVGIVRPSIVVSTEKEPLESWIKGLNGPTAVFVGVLVGILRVMHIDESQIIDFIPADKVASAIIAATWDYATKRPKSSMPPVYNIVSNKKKPITWKNMSDYYRHSGFLHEDLASERSLWEPFGILTTCSYLYQTLNVFMHLIPGLLIDFVLRVAGQTPILMKLYRKGAYLMTVMDVYHKVEWTFDDDNLYSIWDRMTSRDRSVFNFSMVDFDWQFYYFNYMRGLKVYLLKEKMDFEPLEKSKRRRRIIRRLHYTVCTVLILTGLWMAKCITTFAVNKMNSTVFI